MRRSTLALLVVETPRAPPGERAHHLDVGDIGPTMFVRDFRQRLQKSDCSGRRNGIGAERQFMLGDR